MPGASIFLAPDKVGLGEVDDGGGGGLQLRFLAHQFVELFEGFGLVLAEGELIAVDGAIPALGLLSHGGFAHGLIRVSCIESCGCSIQ